LTDYMTFILQGKIMADQKSSEETSDSFTMENGFFNHLGFRLVTWEEDLAVLEFEIEPYHLNRALVLHGGVLTSIIDIACGFSGCFSLDPNRVRKAVTLSLTTSFTGQATSGIVRAVGCKRVSGRKIFVATAEVTSGSGDLLALGEGTYRYRSGSEPVDEEPSGGAADPADPVR